MLVAVPDAVDRDRRPPVIAASLVRAVAVGVLAGGGAGSAVGGDPQPQLAAPRLALPFDGPRQGDVASAGQFHLEAVYERRKETSTGYAVEVDAGPATQEVLDAYRLDGAVAAQRFGLAEPGVVPRPVHHQPAVGPAGRGTPGVVMAGASQGEQCRGTPVIGAGVEEAAQLVVEAHRAPTGVEREDAAGEGAAVAGPFRVTSGLASPYTWP